MNETKNKKICEIPPDRIDNILIGLLYHKGKINKKTYENYQKTYNKR